MDSWQSPLSSRYASKEMSNLFSNAVSKAMDANKLLDALWNMASTVVEPGHSGEGAGPSDPR